jgi:DNA-binding transcriptional MerR regulator
MTARAPQPELVKMAVLARRSGVPAPTIKHYLREGLLPKAVVKTSRNMALYDASIVARIRAIKELQRTRFLPLKVIRDMLDAGTAPEADVTAAEAIARVLAEIAPVEERTRAQLLQSGVRAPDLEALEAAGLLTPEGTGPQARYRGDDVALLQTLGASRKAGLAKEMLPFEILADYVRAIRELVRVELSLFRAGVLPQAGEDLPALAEAATTLSERLVVLLRRKLLLPTLRQLVEAESKPAKPIESKPATRRRKHPRR